MSAIIHINKKSFALTLPATGKWVVLDSDTAPLNKLTVVGVLEIPGDANSSSSRAARSAPVYSTVVIDAVYISIQVSVIDRSSAIERESNKVSR